MHNADLIISHDGLAVDERAIALGKTSKLHEFQGRNGYCYAEGPEFRLEYIHNRVED
jgi:hypothetical protein